MIKIVGGVVLFVVVFCLYVLGVGFLWDLSIGSIFELKEITLSQSFGLALLIMAVGGRK